MCFFLGFHGSVGCKLEVLNTRRKYFNCLFFLLQTSAHSANSTGRHRWVRRVSQAELSCVSKQWTLGLRGTSHAAPCSRDLWAPQRETSVISTARSSPLRAVLDEREDDTEEMGTSI